MNRRDMFRQGGLMAAAGLVGVEEAAADGPADVYQSIGVRPVINCKGTFTIISGSQSLPEVKQAMDEASRHYVHLDELMDGGGAATGGADAGGVGHCDGGVRGRPDALPPRLASRASNPEKMQRLPRPDWAEERGGHAAVLAQRLRPRHPHARREHG